MTRKLLIILSMAVFAFGVAGFSPSAAHAICYDPQCEIGDIGDEDPPPPAPTTTKISSISPGFAWSGDAITLTGTGFTGATISINNQPATISSNTSTKIVVTVPTISNTVAGPQTIPVVVSSPTGTASTSFTLSPTLQVSASATYGVNAEFGQGTDGSAWATATLDRSSGFVNSKLTVKNTQTWWDLTVNMSVAWLDSSGKVIGFTTPHSVTSSGWMYSWPTGDTTRSASFTDVVGPSPAVAPFARSAQIVLVRDHQAELQGTLSNAVALGKTIGQVLTTLAPFLA